MSIIRVVKDSRQRFLLMDAEIHLRPDLSWEARGLHSYLMLKPDNWEVYINNLMKAGPAGKDKLQRMLKELQEAGYINRIRVRDPKTGRLSTITEVYETIGLNQGETPIYGGSQNGHSGKTALDHSGFTGDGKPGRITNLNSTIYKGDFRHLEIDGPSEEDLSEKQVVHDMSVALGSVCLGFVNLLVPDNCPFYQAARTLIAAGITEQQVQDFGPWWTDNGLYEGKPHLKSLMNKIENMIAGVNPGKKKSKSADLVAATKEVFLWIDRRIQVSEFSSPFTLPAIQGVGESTIRGIGDHNRTNILNKFEQEYERAKQNA